jgi:serine/threonine protein kinase
MDKVKINPPMSEANKCPQCGTLLPTGAPGGLCPACLLKMGAAADTVTDAKQPPFNPPGVAELAPLFPQLEILELIGKGGMGAVYKARQKQLDRIVALKILPPGIGDDPAFAERFAREAKALAKLNHPNIVTLYEFGNASGQFYFLMEFVDGVNLRQLLHAGRISAREALAIVPQICDALQFAHDQGIVHRDIKPENILLDRRGRVKVADFGLAKIVAADGGASVSASRLVSSLAPPEAGLESPALTDAGKTMGTPQYMSPEQITAPGEVDHRADIYALGVVFYQMLTGELPGKKIEPPSSKVQIDVRLDEIVLRALEKNPELRYQQVSEVKTCVEAFAAMPGLSGSRGDESQAESGKSGECLATPVAANQTPRFSRMALVGAIWSGIGLLTVVLAVLFELKDSLAGKMLLLIVLTAPIGTTILGWVAVAQIRRSAGKIYGMGLAVFDGLFFPLLALDALIGGFWLLIQKAVNPYHQMIPIWALLMFATIAGIDLLTVRWVWRAMNKSVATLVPPMIQKPDRFWRWFAVAVFALISIPFLISILGILAAIAIPNFVKARAKAQENARHAAQMFAAQNNSFDSTTNFYIGQTNFPQGDSIEITSVERNENQMIVKGHYNLVSHDSALLALYITTTNNIAVPTDSDQQMQISKGSGDFELTHPHLVPGLPHVSMYADGHSFAALYFGSKTEALKENKASWITNAPSASAEIWSPTLAPGEKPDVQKIRDEIKTLMEQQKYEEALQRQIWYFNHALEYGEVNPVRLSFGIMNWHELGQRYPKAKQALIEIRDRDVREFSEGRGYSELFLEVQNLNRELHDDGATLTLFKTIYQQDKQLAGQCYGYAENLLMQNGDYDLCLKCIGDPQTRFESARRGFEMQKENQERMAEIRKQFPAPAVSLPRGFPAPPDMGQMATNNFVGQVCTLVEILVATDHKVDAEKIQDEANEVLDDTRLKSAVSDAIKKMQANIPVAFQPSEPSDLREAKAKLAELEIDHGPNHPAVQKQIARIKELERLTREEPNAPADVREAKASLAELRSDYGEQNPNVQRALARVNELERMTKEEPDAPADLREAKANLAELSVDYAEQNPEVQKALARVNEFERMTKEEPNDSSELREAKAHLAELRVDFAEQNPEVQKALARIKALEQK